MLLCMIGTGAIQSERKRRKRIAGIGQSADALNVTRQHLGMVIRGDRTSKSLLAKYKALMAGERQSRLLLVRSTSVKVEHTKSARTIK